MWVSRHGVGMPPSVSPQNRSCAARSAVYRWWCPCTIRPSAAHGCAPAAPAPPASSAAASTIRVVALIAALPSPASRYKACSIAAGAPRPEKVQSAGKGVSAEPPAKAVGERCREPARCSTAGSQIPPQRRRSVRCRSPAGALTCGCGVY